MTINQYLEQQSDEFLRVCFNELESFRTEGVLVDGEVRNLNQQFFNSNPTTLFTIGELIYREIAVRHYR